MQWFLTRQRRSVLLRLAGGAAWLYVIGLAASYIVRDATIAAPSSSYLYDWHFYLAGAYDLVERTLYRVPLTGPWPLPADVFDNPPLGALWALLLAPLGEAMAGTTWQVLNTGALFIGVLLGCRVLGISWAWGGLALAAYVRVFPAFWEAGVQLGNNSWLVLGLIMGFAWAHQRSQQLAAGVLLGLAIATKLWPAPLLAVALRQRRWRELAIALMVVAVQGLAFLLWLGPDVVPHVIDRLASSPEPDSEVFFIGGLRVYFDWWPAWGGLAVAAVFLAIPATGRLGIGLALMAGLSIKPNVWHHLLPTVVIALALTAAGIVDAYRSRTAAGRGRPEDRPTEQTT